MLERLTHCSVGDHILTATYNKADDGLNSNNRDDGTSLHGSWTARRGAWLPTGSARSSEKGLVRNQSSMCLSGAMHTNGVSLTG